MACSRCSRRAADLQDLLVSQCRPRHWSSQRGGILARRACCLMAPNACRVICEARVQQPRLIDGRVGERLAVRRDNLARLRSVSRLPNSARRSFQTIDSLQSQRPQVRKNGVNSARRKCLHTKR
jgi:hypothetical protein